MNKTTEPGHEPEIAVSRLLMDNALGDPGYGNRSMQKTAGHKAWILHPYILQSTMCGSTTVKIGNPMVRTVYWHRFAHVILRFDGA